MFWRRSPAPEIPLTERDVQGIFDGLFKIHATVMDIWAVVGGEEDGEEEDEP
jgi:hypothetical protein